MEEHETWKKEGRFHSEKILQVMKEGTWKEHERKEGLRSMEYGMMGGDWNTKRVKEIT